MKQTFYTLNNTSFTPASVKKNALCIVFAFALFFGGAALNAQNETSVVCPPCAAEGFQIPSNPNVNQLVPHQEQRRERTQNPRSSGSVFTLDFEGLDNIEPILDFYNGGTSQNGNSGTDYGIGFSSSALAIIDSDEPGGTGNIGNEPSPSTVLFFLGGDPILNLPSGFDTGFSFFYASTMDPGSVSVYDGLDGTGNLLGSASFEATGFGPGDPNGIFSNWAPVSVSFSGTARSIVFSGVANQIAFDNVTFGSVTPGEGDDPEPTCSDLPEASCSSTTVSLDANGNATINAESLDGGSTDPCEGTLSFSASQTAFGCGDLGSNMVTLTVTNDNGSDQCTATVMVNDPIFPTAACLNTTVELQPTGTYGLQLSDIYDAANSSDNCAITAVSFPTTNFDCSDLGETFPVSVTVSDAAGNNDNCTANVTVALGTALPAGWSAHDVGAQSSSYSYDPCAPNGGDYDISTDAYHLIPNTSDNVAFASLPLCGNGGIQARIDAVSGGYAGLMIRESSAPGAKMTAIYSNLTNLLRRETRYETNGVRSSGTSYASFPFMLRLVRQGDWIRGFYKNGSQWIQFHQVYLPMGTCVEMGLAVFTTDPSGQASATFDKVNYMSSQYGLAAPNTNGGAEALSDVQRAKVFPNPTAGAFTVDFDRPLEVAASAVLRNELGQAVQQLQIPAGTVNHNVDGMSLPRGLYFLEVQDGQGYREVLKVIKQ